MGNKHEFFKAMEQQFLGLSYDDVRLHSDHSDVMPEQAVTKSFFSRNICLNTPIVSAPMDRVTMSTMAIAMARLGGLGIIHRKLDAKEQVKEIRRVKLHLNGLISSPITVREDECISEIEKRRQEKQWEFHSFPVVDRDGKLVGIITNSEFIFCENNHAKAKEIMTNNVITAKVGTDLAGAYEAMKHHKKKVLPIVDDCGHLAGMYLYSDVKRIITGNREGFSVDSNGQLRVGAAIGTGQEEVEQAALLVKAGVDVLVIDTAHGDSEPVYKTLKAVKKLLVDIHSNVDVVVGNVSEGPSAQRLAEAGADGIKAGQGPGSICTTRIIAGIGCPQVTAVYNCAEAAKSFGVPVCADGGIRYSGDIPVAIGAGAGSVMMGLLLAGTDESPGKVTVVDGVMYKEYRGMGSLGAMQDSQISRRRYGQKNVANDQIVPEGVEGLVPYRGPLSRVVHDNIEGLRRGMGYVGAANIAALQERASFRRNTEVGSNESHPHNIEHVKDAPNYQMRRS